MTMYSDRLGEITHEQLQKALDTFDLGKLIKAEPVSQGLFGQNIFITSDFGHFVLRGKPHYDWQFRNEKLFAELLHEKTNVPVPYPYLLDSSKEIFGREYVIMPRMNGKNLSDGLEERDISDSDRFQIANAQGKILREAQKLTNDYCGMYDLSIDGIKPYKPDWFTEFAWQINDRLEKSMQHNSNTQQSDLDWANELISQAKDSIEDFIPTFFMQDFKPGNMVADKVNGIWEITGLFDLMEASFGHPESDISRMFAVYVERGRDDLAYAFINSYLPGNLNIEKFNKRFQLFMLHDKSIIWEWVQRTNCAWWNKNWTFKQWMSVFMKIESSKITV